MPKQPARKTAALADAIASARQSALLEPNPTKKAKGLPGRLSGRLFAAVDIARAAVSIMKLPFGAFVYRLGHGPLKAERRVRFPYALPL
jgi:hypothetical protein